MSNPETCVICGEVIPEGRQVCPICENNILKDKKYETTDNCYCTKKLSKLLTKKKQSHLIRTSVSRKRLRIMKYKNETHQIIYKSFVSGSSFRYSNSFLAATFLLSAEKELWRRTKKAIQKKQILLDQIDKTNLNLYASTLLRIASDIYAGTNYVSLQDIGDRYIVSDKTFELVTEALYLFRNGYDKLDFTKRFN